ncbi:MAG: acetoacetate--CoA ligase [Rhodobacteraceae bacterium]|nr:acetoacetate--CoA ligase [Paracoccaceae bacterium]
MTDKLWEPSSEQVLQTNLAQFMQKINVGYSVQGLDYDELWEYSISSLDNFWQAVWDFTDIKGVHGNVVIDQHPHIRDTKFFPHARLNYAENLMCKKGSESAIIYYGENHHHRELSWDDLWAQVASIQTTLLEFGVKKGDVIGGIVSNSPEAVIAMLATTSLGAVWSSCSPDFGINGILDRFGQVRPKIIFGVEGYYYNGKWNGCSQKCIEVQSKITSAKKLILIPYTGGNSKPSTSNRKVIQWAECLNRNQRSEIGFEPVPFSSPLFIMFSSGTTGKPKCIVHSVGGALLQHKKEHLLHINVVPANRMMFFTTCGWMMWNWMVSALASQVTIVLYDGSPVYPNVERLSQIIEKSQINQFGSSAKYFELCAQQNFRAKEKYDVASLQTIMSTGSPLMAEIFDYLYSDWKDDFCVSSMSGGTDILCCFVGGSPISPVYRGQCQKRMLGMDVRVFNEHGNAVVEESGELVCCSPHPSIPIGFWGDYQNEKFNSAYFNRFPGVWHQCDWVKLTKEGGMVFYGRSDATLNPSGVRIGTAEIYRPVEQIPEVVESLVIGKNAASDVEVILFVKLVHDCELSDKLIDRIKNKIRSMASPRHVPKRVFQVDDLPRTRSGKLVELAVRDILDGKEIKNIEALANPEALEQFAQLKEKIG